MTLIMLLALAEERAQPREDGLNQMLELIFVPECVIQRASGSCRQVCFGLITPDLGPPVLLQYFWKVNLLEADHSTVLLAEGQ